MSVHVPSQVRFILANPIAYVTNQMTIFVVDIDSVHSHMAFQTAVDAHTVSQKIYELPIGYYKGTCINWAYDLAVLYIYIYIYNA